MFKTISALAATLLAASVLIAPSASADPIVITPPPPGHITIDVATVNGSGCAPGTAAVSVAPDNTAFTVTYSEYLAQAGGDSDPTDSRKNCQLALQVSVPQGYTYAIARADYRGYADLAEGATGMQKASYYFQGMEQTIPVEHDLAGPMNDNWQFSDEAGIYIYAPCNAKRNFNINTELRVDAGDSHPNEVSFLAMDSTDGSISTTYQFSWKLCEY